MFDMDMSGRVTFIPELFHARREHIQFIGATLYPQGVPSRDVGNHDMTRGAFKFNQ